MTVRTDENLPWVEKYRPLTLDDVYGQEEIVNTVRRFVSSGKLPHLLFYGPPGTGKTSTVVALAREIYGPRYKNSVLELNASDDRGIDVVRDQIKNFALTRQIFDLGFKLIILDEADLMTLTAQNALRRVIEKYTKNTRFCILANYAHKLNPALLLRCTRFRFSPIPQEAIRERVDRVVVQEKLDIGGDAVLALLDLSRGDMRKALNVLQACQAAAEREDGSGSDPITAEMIYECVGAPPPQCVDTILQLVLHDDWLTCYSTVTRVRVENGLALVDIISAIVDKLEAVELPPKARTAILARLADVEYAISKGGNDRIQTSAMIGYIKSGLGCA